MTVKLWVWRMLLGAGMCTCAAVVLARATDLNEHLLAIVAMGGGISVLLGVISDILSARANGNGHRDYNHERG